MSAGEACDYCHAADSNYLRAVGFTEFDGHTAPLVKTWCGHCDTPTDTDPDAHAALLRAVQWRQGGAS